MCIKTIIHRNLAKYCAFAVGAISVYDFVYWNLGNLDLYILCTYMYMYSADQYFCHFKYVQICADQSVTFQYTTSYRYCVLVSIHKYVIQRRILHHVELPL